jgi:hypothetical protein
MVTTLEGEGKHALSPRFRYQTYFETSLLVKQYCPTYHNCELCFTTLIRAMEGGQVHNNFPLYAYKLRYFNNTIDIVIDLAGGSSRHALCLAFWYWFIYCSTPWGCMMVPMVVICFLAPSVSLCTFNQLFV